MTDKGICGNKMKKRKEKKKKEESEKRKGKERIRPQYLLSPPCIGVTNLIHVGRGITDKKA
jgi:hypothetical protein